MRFSFPGLSRFGLISALAAFPALVRAEPGLADGPQASSPAPGVDFAALQKDGRAIFAQIQASHKAYQESGSKEPFRIDPGILDPLRKRADGASGELKEALMVQEFALASQLQMPSSFKERVFKEVKPGSNAWKVAPDLAPYLEQICGKDVKPYVDSMRLQGVPEVRAGLLAADAMRLLQESNDGEAAQASIAKALALAPDSPMVKMTAEMVRGEMKTTLGQQAPDFRLPDIENPGRTFTLADFKGTYVLLDFWGTWCGWCVKELPNTHQVYGKFKGRGLEILSLAKEAKGETVQAFRKKPGFPMPWKHALLNDTDGKPDPTVTAYGVMGYPSLFLIGPDGKLLAKGNDLREAGLEKTLEKFLKPSAVQGGVH